MTCSLFLSETPRKSCAAMDRKGAMNIYDRLKKAYRQRELGRLLGQETPSAEHVREAAELVIRRAKKDEASGIRKDRWLFEFESSIEEVMDSIMHLSQDGQTGACREIYEKLYDFAVYAMEDTYMPLYLYILYRYANTLLETGDAEKALPLFEKLVAKTDRLIGIHNPYGIHCFERVATAAAQSGDVERARKAIGEMHKIAIEEYGLGSAMALAVRKYAARSGLMR